MPVPSQPADARPPGGGRLALFAECLLTGVLVTAAALPLLTLLPAFAAGCAHLTAHLEHRGTTLRDFAGHLRQASRGALLPSLAIAAALALLWLDVTIARAGLPGGAAVAWVCALAAATLAVVALRAAATWQPGPPPSWWTLLRQAAHRTTVQDRAGSLLLLLALAATVVLTWQLPPLLVPMLGCLALAAVTVEHRHARQPRHAER